MKKILHPKTEYAVLLHKSPKDSRKKVLARINKGEEYVDPVTGRIRSRKDVRRIRYRFVKQGVTGILAKQR